MPDGELTPVTVPRLDRVATQDLLCKEILEKAPQEDAEKAYFNNWKCPGTVDAKPFVDNLRAVVSFCRDPLTKTVATAPSGEAIDEALRDLKAAPAERCATAATGATIQSGALGLPFQDTVVRGLASFVVARTKAEAMSFLVNRLARKLCNAAHAMELLPASCGLLTTNEAEMTAWGTLKAAFETDMVRFPERALACAVPATQPGIKMLVYNGAQIARLSYRGEDPLATLAGLKRTEYTQQECKKSRLDCGLHMFGVDTIGRTVKNLKAKLADPETKVDRLGAVATMARSGVGALDLARQMIVGWYGKELLDDDAKLDANDVAELKRYDEKAKRLIAVVNDALDAYDKIAHSEYAHVYIVAALALQALKATRYGDDLDAQIQKYMPFVAEVAAAKTSDDVKRALETAAAPVGASRMKRGKDQRTIAVTAFAGGIVGGERVYQLDKQTNDGWQGGLFVPIGIDVSWGVCEHASLGAFVSPAEVRDRSQVDHGENDAGDNKIESAPEIGFTQIVSPGAYFVVGLDRVAFGFGASIAPELRRITADGVLVENATTIRVGAFLAIDVTIFPF